ncbi:MAG: dienelactone hydrolase family protein [Xanthobacteraceae bacterium]
MPAKARALVAFAHGSGSSSLSPRNAAVAEALNERGFATLLFDLLHRDEDQDRTNVFNIPLLAGRLNEAVRWLDLDSSLARLPLGFFGASTGAAAALVAAAELGQRVGAVVCRGGRPDLAKPALAKVRAATLLIVGGADTEVLDLNRRAFADLHAPKALRIIEGATHLFPEPGAMETVIDGAVSWFEHHLRAEHSTGGDVFPDLF